MTTPGSSSGRLVCLDGLRGALATYVMLGHMAPFLALSARWDAGRAALSHGMAAVDVFFVLSGLVIVRSLDAFGGQPAPFLRARAARIFPTFLAVFALALAVQPLATPFAAMPWIGAHGAARDIWSGGWPEAWAPRLLAHLTMTHGLFPDGVLPDVWVNYLGAAWSLSTEWQFYLLVTLLALRGGSSPADRQRLAALFVVVAAAAAVWALLAPPDLRFSRAFLPNKAQYFALGIASAGLVAQPGRRMTWRYGGFLLAVLALCALEPGGAGKLAAPLVWSACLAAQLWPQQAALRPLSALLRAPALVWLGAISYPLYLVNEPVQKLLGVALAALSGGSGVLFDLFWLPLALLLPIAAAQFLHVRVELPALRWGRTAIARAPAPAAS